MGIGHAICRSVVVLAIGGSLLLSGCTRTSQSDLDKAKAVGASEQAAKQSASAQQEAQAKLAAEVQKLKEQLAAKTAAATPSTVTKAAPAQPAQPAQPQGTSCGSNVSAGQNTTCAFALNVAAEYLTQGGGTRTIDVYSPVTNQYYSMTCVAGVPTVCRGGSNAVVYIR
jgi:membrane protein involved in colicin uptake